MRLVSPGDDLAEELGFTYLKFDGKLDVHLQDYELYLYYIRSLNPREGNVRLLLEQWISDGWDVRVVMPNLVMQALLNDLGFTEGAEVLPRMYPREGRREVWHRPPQ
jgi:hypothetical protein